MLKIIDINDPKWMNFIQSKPEAHIFHHPAWANNLAACYGYRPFAAVEINAEGKLIVGAPFMEVNSFITGKRWVSMPFSDHCTPLSDSAEALQTFIDDLLVYHRQAATPPIEIRWDLPEHPEIHRSTRHVLHTRLISNDPDVVFEGLHKKVRKYARSSGNRGVRIETGTSQEFLKRFYFHQVRTRMRHGVPVQPWRYFEQLGKNLLEKGMGFVMLAYKENECLAGLVCLHWNGKMVLKYGASDTNDTELRPTYLLDWSALEWASQHDIHLADVGRSQIDEEGLRDYKNRWGYQEMPLTYCSIGKEPGEFGSSNLMKLMNTVIQHSPEWVCRASGALLYRHIG